MKVVITGKGGQLASELERPSPQGYQITSVSRSEVDITNESLISQFITSTKPDLVINAAAYTAVDKAESNIEAAYAVNEQGTKYLANACKRINARILHVSTDFVFDGSSTLPYQTDSNLSPINIYGASKLAGEVALLKILPKASVIVRTSWVYSVKGNNFVKNMLRLMQEKNELSIIYDQVGTPTWAKGLAQLLWIIADRPEVKGIYNWSDGGIASWYDFAIAIAIQELGLEKGLLKEAIPIYPITTSEYPTPARRPACPVINKTSAEDVSGLRTTHWRKQLSSMMDGLI
jgi:dTDP-4-dehydrorhamnose reductase